MKKSVERGIVKNPGVCRDLAKIAADRLPWKMQNMNNYKQHNLYSSKDFIWKGNPLVGISSRRHVARILPTQVGCHYPNFFWNNTITKPNQIVPHGNLKREQLSQTPRPIHVGRHCPDPYVKQTYFNNFEYLKTAQHPCFKGFQLRRKSPHGNLKQETFLCGFRARW